MSFHAFIKLVETLADDIKRDIRKSRDSDRSFAIRIARYRRTAFGPLTDQTIQTNEINVSSKRTQHQK